MMYPVRYSTRRLDVLDGLRGFAIILVLLNHIDSFYIAAAVPDFFKPVIHFLFTSGNLGVTFFFILSGFLMGYLYKDPNPREFIERRYARIFPPFLVMVVCMWIFRLYPNTSLFLRVALMLSIATIARLIWIYGVERFHKGSILIKLFLLLQLIIAFWYCFVVMRKPAVWFDSLPFFLKEGSIFASNATLTLPLGNYIPLLDGVYWSLAPEMIFYLLYPYLFSPTAQALSKKSKMFIIFFIVSLFPFFLGLSLLFKHSQGLTMLFIEYFIYFCGGLVISHQMQREQKKTSTYIKNFINPVTFISVLFLSYVILGKTSLLATIVLRMFLVIPFGYIVYSLIEDNTPLSRLFRHKIFFFLGTISYSLYIGHTAIVQGLHQVFKPYNLGTNVLFLLVAFGIFFLVASAFHLIIETPYFQFKPIKHESKNDTLNIKIVYGTLVVVILFLFFSTYTSQFNFFSLQKRYRDVIPSSLPIAISDVPYTFSFTSQEDNMGVILIHLTNTVGNSIKQTQIKNPLKQQRFQIRMKEKGVHEWYASQNAAPAEIGNSSSYPFGFPPIVDSKNRTYIVEMSIRDIDYRSTVIFNNDEYELTTVHQIQKMSLLKNPLKLASHIMDKLKTALSDPEARLVAICISPFFILLFSL